MSTPFQIVIDCRDPELLARFWAATLGYVLEPPPDGFATWDDWRRGIGPPTASWGWARTASPIPAAAAPASGSGADDAAKVVKNRLHFDIHVSGGRTVTEARSVPLATRTQRVDAEATRLAGLGATITGPLGDGSLDHYAVGMKDPEGNEFDIN